MENNTKSIYTINPAITENTECPIIKVQAPVINLKVGLLFDHGVLLHSSSLNSLGTIPNKE